MPVRPEEAFFVSADGSHALYGAPWQRVRRDRWAVLRCRLGGHRTVQWERHGGVFDERCSCGAVRTGSEGPWAGGDAGVTRLHPSEEIDRPRPFGGW